MNVRQPLHPRPASTVSSALTCVPGVSSGRCLFWPNTPPPGTRSLVVPLLLLPPAGRRLLIAAAARWPAECSQMQQRPPRDARGTPVVTCSPPPLSASSEHAHPRPRRRQASPTCPRPAPFDRFQHAWTAARDRQASPRSSAAITKTVPLEALCSFAGI